MKTPRIVDKLSRSIGGWLKYHNFRATELWPAKQEFQKAVDTQYALYLQALSELTLFKPDVTSTHIIEANEFTAYGAYMFSDTINKQIFDVSKYSDAGHLQALRTSYGTRFSSILNTSRTKVHTHLLDACADRKILDVSVWSEVFKSCPDILVLSLFNHTDVVGYSKKLVRGIFALQQYHYQKFDRYDVDGTYYKELEAQLLQDVCAGFHILSYTMYAVLHSRLPASFSAKMPSLKLKMKAYSDNEYFYIPS